MLIRLRTTVRMVLGKNLKATRRWAPNPGGVMKIAAAGQAALANGSQKATRRKRCVAFLFFGAAANAAEVADVVHLWHGPPLPNSESAAKRRRVFAGVFSWCGRGTAGCSTDPLHGSCGFLTTCPHAQGWWRETAGNRSEFRLGKAPNAVSPRGAAAPVATDARRMGRCSEAGRRQQAAGCWRPLG